MRPGQTTLPAAAATATALLFLLSGLALTSGCNKALCASDVSKCLIQVKHAFPLRLQISVGGRGPVYRRSEQDANVSCGSREDSDS